MLRACRLVRRQQHQARVYGIHTDMIGGQLARRLQNALDAERQDGASHAEFVSHRLRFHHLLAEACGNRLLQATASALFRLTGEVILEVKPVREVIHRPEEHAEVLRAIRVRDGAAAAQAMQLHLETMGRQLTRLEGIYRRRRGLAKEIRNPKPETRNKYGHERD